MTGVSSAMADEPELTRVPLDVHIAGIPGFSSGDVLIAGEDLANNRLMVTVVDWARMVQLGCRTVVDTPLAELELVRDSLTRYIDSANEEAVSSVLDS